MKRSPSAIADLCARFGLPPASEPKFSCLSELLSGDPLAPTAVRDPGRVVGDHLADSLVALELEAVTTALQIADLGAGAGVPGLPLAIALPAAEVVLVESNGRKCDFIARAISRCDVGNATVVQARAEDWGDGLERFELVTARALAPLSVVAEYAAPLLVLGGAAVVWRGRRDRAEEQDGAAAAAELGLEMLEPLSVAPYPGTMHRHLQVMTKRRLTPSRFPRRPGIARKRPLAAGHRAAAPSDRWRR